MIPTFLRVDITSSYFYNYYLLDVRVNIEKVANHPSARSALTGAANTIVHHGCHVLIFRIVAIAGILFVTDPNTLMDRQLWKCVNGTSHQATMGATSHFMT
jgi:hypothetical protein